MDVCIDGAHFSPPATRLHAPEQRGRSHGNELYCFMVEYANLILCINLHVREHETHKNMVTCRKLYFLPTPRHPNTSTFVIEQHTHNINNERDGKNRNQQQMKQLVSCFQQRKLFIARLITAKQQMCLPSSSLNSNGSVYHYTCHITHGPWRNSCNCSSRAQTDISTIYLKMYGLSFMHICSSVISVEKEKKSENRRFCASIFDYQYSNRSYQSHHIPHST